MASFSAVAGVAVAALAPEYALPGFVAVEVYRRSAASTPKLLLAGSDGDCTTAWCTMVSGFEYAIGYWVGSYVMNTMFGAQ